MDVMRRVGISHRIFCSRYIALLHHHRYTIWYPVFQNRNLRAVAFRHQYAGCAKQLRLHEYTPKYHMDTHCWYMDMYHASLLWFAFVHHYNRDTLWQKAFSIVSTGDDTFREASRMKEIEKGFLSCGHVTSDTSSCHIYRI